MGMDIFDAVAVSCSVPFRDAISGHALRQALLDGYVTDDLFPHIERALAELPISLLARMVFAYPIDQRPTVIRHLTDFAEQVGVGGRISAWLNG